MSAKCIGIDMVVVVGVEVLLEQIVGVCKVYGGRYGEDGGGLAALVEASI